jgi:predicted Rossmann fold flavoprotein
VLSAFPAAEAAAFFREIGVALHEEPGGKLFPDTNRARTVVDALLREAGRAGVHIETNRRVTGVERAGDGFRLATSRGPLEARRLVIATGGLSIPKSGSDGAGYAFARALGHSVVRTTPALAPLVVDGGFHAELKGASLPVEIAVFADGRKPQRVRGPLLFTHFGVSGPAALDASRFWHRASVEGRGVRVALSFLPDETFESADAWLVAEARKAPRRSVEATLAQRLPAALAESLVRHQRLEGTPLGRFGRDERRALVHALVEQPLAVRDSRGYNYAEVTSGGVALDEVKAATLESRLVPGLHFVGEILDVDGRIGGFNFQWAWSSGFVAGRALAASSRATPASSGAHTGPRPGKDDAS